MKLGGLLGKMKGEGGEEGAAGKAAPNMFAVAAAAKKFKRGAAATQVSREKRELLKKVVNDRKFKLGAAKVQGRLEELFRPYLENAPAGRNEDKELASDASSNSDDGAGAEGSVPDKVLKEMKDILNAFNEESVQIACDTWEVDSHAKKLKTATDHLATAEKVNRDAHQGFMKELLSSKNQIAQLQNKPILDIKINSNDIVFYEVTEYLSEEQRQLVKDMVEYKVRAELTRGTALEDLADGNAALKKQLEEQEAKLKELEMALGDSQSMVKNMRLEQDERMRADMDKRIDRRPSTPMVSMNAKDTASQTDMIKDVVVTKDAAVKETRDATTDVNDSFPTLYDTMSAECQTDPVQFSNGKEVEVTVYKEAAKPESRSNETQTEAEEAAAPDPMLEQLARAAQEAESRHREMKEALEAKQSENLAIQAELAKAKRDLKAAQDAGGPVKIVEVAAVKAPTAIQEVQTDPMETVVSYAGPSELEQALELKARDEVIRELKEEMQAKAEENTKLTKDNQTLKKELENLKDWIKDNPGTGGAPVNVTGGASSEELEKAQEANLKLKAENKKLQDELEESKEMNTKLEVAINELTAKLKMLQEQLRSAGMGHIADRMFDNAGLAEILSNKPLSVFDRLYNDALKRVRRTPAFTTVAKSPHAQALLSTVQHINHAGNPPPQQPGAAQSFASPPTYAAQPQQFAPQQYPPQQYSPQQYAPQQYAPQQYAPQQYAPQQYGGPPSQNAYQGQQQRPPQRPMGMQHAGPQPQQRQQFGNPFMVTNYGQQPQRPQFVAQAQQGSYQDFAQQGSHQQQPAPYQQQAAPPQSPPKPPSRSLVNAEMGAGDMEPGNAQKPPEEPAEEIKIVINTQVRATEKMQFKIGARSVIVKVGAIGKVVQMYPQLGVDWECLPSVDKIFVEADMIEAVPLNVPPPQPQADPRQNNMYMSQTMDTFHNPNQGFGGGGLPPQMASPQMASPLPQMSPGMRPGLSQMAPGMPGMARSQQSFGSSGNVFPSMAKSSSTPSFPFDSQQGSPVKSNALPRLESPGKVRAGERGRGGLSPEGLNMGGQGQRPLSMSSNANYFKQPQGPAGPAPPDEKRAGHQRSNGPRAGSLPPSQKTKFSMCIAGASPF